MFVSLMCQGNYHTSHRIHLLLCLAVINKNLRRRTVVYFFLFDGGGQVGGSFADLSFSLCHGYASQLKR